jgi:hypothetical protein
MVVRTPIGSRKYLAIVLFSSTMYSIKKNRNEMKQKVKGH